MYVGVCTSSCSIPFPNNRTILPFPFTATVTENVVSNFNDPTKNLDHGHFLMRSLKNSRMRSTKTEISRPVQAFYGLVRKNHQILRLLLYIGTVIAAFPLKQRATLTSDVSRREKRATAASANNLRHCVEAPLILYTAHFATSHHTTSLLTMILRCNRILVVFLALAAVGISAKQSLRGSSSTTSTIDVDQDGTSSTISIRVDHNIQTQLQQQLHRRKQKQSKQQRHGQPKQRQLQRQQEQRRIQFESFDPGMYSTFYGGAFGGDSNAGTGDTTFSSYTQGLFTNTPYAALVDPEAAAEILALANSPGLAPLEYIRTNFDRTVSQADSDRTTDGEQEIIRNDPGQGTNSTSFATTELDVQMGSTDARVTGSGNATGTSESFAQAAPAAPTGTSTETLGGIPGQTNPDNPDGGPTPPTENVAVIAVSGNGPSGSLTVTIIGNNTGDAFTSNNLADVQDFLEGIQGIEEFIESLRPELLDFNDFIDRFTEQTGIEPATFVTLGCSVAGGRRSRRLQGGSLSIPGDVFDSVGLGAYSAAPPKEDTVIVTDGGGSMEYVELPPTDETTTVGDASATIVHAPAEEALETKGASPADESMVKTEEEIPIVLQIGESIMIADASVTPTKETLETVDESSETAAVSEVSTTVSDKPPATTVDETIATANEEARGLGAFNIFDRDTTVVVVADDEAATTTTEENTGLAVSAEFLPSGEAPVTKEKSTTPTDETAIAAVIIASTDEATTVPNDGTATTGEAATRAETSNVFVRDATASEGNAAATESETAKTNGENAGLLVSDILLTGDAWQGVQILVLEKPVVETTPATEGSAVDVTDGVAVPSNSAEETAVVGDGVGTIEEEQPRCAYNSFGDEGTFVCRTLYQPVTGEAQIQTVCCNPDRALDSDKCGCCGGSCPNDEVRPEIEFADFIDTLEQVDFIQKFNEEAGLRQSEFVGLPCKADRDDSVCSFNSNGDIGVWVCRTIFSPFTGDPSVQSVCADPDKALSTDDCGCCNGICPPSPCSCSCDLNGDGGSKGRRVFIEQGEESTEKCLSPQNAVMFSTRYEKFECIDQC